jgi:dipeptidase E
VVDAEATVRLYLSSFRVGDQPERLLALLGDGRRTALIANSMDPAPAEGRAKSVSEEIGRLEGIGLEPVEVDLRDYFGRTAELKNVLSAFDLLWVRGGNTFTLRRALRQSGADDLIVDLLRRNAVVYGGYSAGVCVLAPSLRGLELVDPQDDVPDGYDPQVIWEGLGLLPYSVAPHYRSPGHPETEAMEKVVQYFIDNHIRFVAMRDGEVIVIDTTRCLLCESACPECGGYVGEAAGSISWVLCSSCHATFLHDHV